MFPARFVATVSRVMREDSDLLPVDPDAEPEQGAWNDLDTVPANAFYAFAMLLPWRLLDTLMRVEKIEKEGIWAQIQGFSIAFVMPEIKPESLLAFLVVPLGMFWAQQFRAVLLRVTGNEVSFKEAWMAVAYVKGAGFAAFFVLMITTIPIIHGLSGTLSEDASMGLAFVVAFMGLGIFMACLKALARATGEEEIEIYLALFVMFCFPYLAFLLPKKA